MITAFLSSIPNFFSSEKGKPIPPSVPIEKARENFSQKLMDILRSAEFKDTLNSVDHGASISNGIISRLNLVEPVKLPVVLAVSRQNSKGNTVQENGNFLLKVATTPDAQVNVLGIQRITSQGGIDNSFTFLPETLQISFLDRNGNERILDILDVDLLDK